METGQIEPFQQLFQDIVNRIPAAQMKQDEVWLHIYHSMLSLFFTYISQSEHRDKWTEWFAYDQLFYGKLLTWGEVTERLWQLAVSIFHVQQDQAADRDREVVRKVKQYIKSHLGGDLSLTQLSKVAGYNHSYLSRLYKEISGEGLSDFITNERLTAARMMLSNPEHKVQDIAETLGFESATYFTRFFKKHTGMTPSEFREFL
ncbi:helix-turn-helix transcriptional regulator [Cohnella soli]|uniref:Helix-turn-helix transcriptional regulator n=1 Tax=Cohnella soli TaxID=425005 RepID=A0ABW0I032_9BACL